MAEVAMSMLKQSLDAFVNRDASLAKQVIKKDDILDDKNVSIIRELLTYMAEYPNLDHLLPRAHLDLEEPRAGGRPRLEHLRGHHLHGRGPVGEAPRHRADPEPIHSGARRPRRTRSRARRRTTGRSGSAAACSGNRGSGAVRAPGTRTAGAPTWRSFRRSGANAYRFSIEWSRVEPRRGVRPG